MAAVNYSAGKPDEGKVILCTYCDQPQPVGRKAKTITCRHCYKRLDLEDANIKHYDARRALETCGTILVDKSGTVVAAKVHCAALTVRGKIKGNVFSRGPVHVAAGAELKGDVTAPAVAIDAGAVLQGHYAIGRPAVTSS